MPPRTPPFAVSVAHDDDMPLAAVFVRPFRDRLLEEGVEAENLRRRMTGC